MTVETATYINGLDSTLPTGSDVKSEGDNHMRLIKSTIKATFPNVTGVMTATHTELNQCSTIASGTYSPTVTGVLNASNGALAGGVAFQYLRVGSVVTVSGAITFDASGAAVGVAITLPVASAFTSHYHCCGTAAYYDGSSTVVAAIRAETVGDTAYLEGVVTPGSGLNYKVQFTYRIL